ncbi:hypothetical protein HN289_20210 [Acinetobacter baumannii]|nr:hypothetical protein [Acinetobacter baumannii]
MDDQLFTVGGEQDDQFEQVGGSGRTDDEPPIGILADVLDGEGVVDGVEHVVIGNAVTSGGSVDLHTEISYYGILQVCI